MKVCFFAHASNLTGANRSLLDVVEVLQGNNNFDFLIVLPRRGPVEDELLNRNIRYTIIKSYGGITNNSAGKLERFFKKYIKKFLNFFSGRKIKKLFSEEKFDLIHINSLLTYKGGEVAFKMKIPYLWHIREFLAEDHGLCFNDEARMILLLNNAVNCIAISDSIRKYFFSKYFLENMSRIYNGIPIEKYSYRRKHNSKEKIISVFGRLSHGKNQLVVIKAVKFLRDHHMVNFDRLIVVGSGEKNDSYENVIKKYVIENNLTEYVEFIPHTNNVLELRKLSDIAVIPSRAEAFGRVTIEAMLAQQVVVASSAGANLELVKNNENGILFEVDDFKELANVIHDIFDDNHRMRKLQENGYEFALSNFSIESTAQGISDIYQKLIKAIN